MMDPYQRFRQLSLFLGVCLPLVGVAQVSNPQDLKKLSLDELMNMEVVSVSRKSEKLLETPSAVQVVTGEDIKRYGASNIPDALYLAGNLQVAQKGSHSWGVSARGFNTELANKLLVLIDGRTVYTPLFSGVFWDRQDYLLNDINQIEVISGPGGTLWGANAVNGVINVTSKSARQTQGLFAEVAAGNELRTLASARYGGKLAPNVYYRVYGRYSNRDAAIYEDTQSKVNDQWLMGQGGFRIDGGAKPQTHFTLQGDFYRNVGGVPTGGNSTVNGGNILARYSHTFSDSSNMRLQMYVDRTFWYDPTPTTILAPGGVFKDGLTTYDVDFQHRFNIWSSNQLIWGLTYRRTSDRVTNSPGLGFFPTSLDQDLYSIFLQDEWSILKNLRLTAGTKLEHNAYVKWVWEPNARIAFNINDRNMIWGAISRAVRTPSRIDRQLSQGTPPYFVILTGGQDFASELVTSREVGWRSQFGSRATMSVSLYHNHYDQIRSTVLNSDPLNPFPLHFENGLDAITYGAELTLTWQVTDWWRLVGSWNQQYQALRLKPGNSDFSNLHNETADPSWQRMIRSTFDLPHHLSVSPAFRYIDNLPINNGNRELSAVASYAELDGRIAWQASDKFEFSVNGRNLLHPWHVEYGPAGPAREGIQRSVYGKITLRM